MTAFAFVIDYKNGIIHDSIDFFFKSRPTKTSYEHQHVELKLVTVHIVTRER
jgi:hypothetical protein